MPQSGAPRWDATGAWYLQVWAERRDIRNRELPEEGGLTLLRLVRPTEAPSQDRVKNGRGHSSSNWQRVSWRRTFSRQAAPCLLRRPKPRSQTAPSPGMPQRQEGECQVCDGLETWLDQC